ncbi:hypothetical protein MTX20_21100 [Bradyrhizobium sp. ISRA435]|nr:hypothetical protein MTX20_21100 [Bradyrhizobium sp. ISRA435]
MAENAEKDRVFCTPPAISLWTASESAIFSGFFQVKALQTPEKTGFARIATRAKPAPRENHRARLMPSTRGVTQGKCQLRIAVACDFRFWK